MDNDENESGEGASRDVKCPECNSWVEVEAGRYLDHGVMDLDIGCEVPCPLSGAEVYEEPASTEDA